MNLYDLIPHVINMFLLLIIFLRSTGGLENTPEGTAEWAYMQIIMDCDRMLGFLLVLCLEEMLMRGEKSRVLP